MMILHARTFFILRLSRLQIVRGECGFAAVDALVALMIISTSIVLSLRAVETARHAALAADETRNATTLLSGLLEAAPHKIESLSGKSPTFDWMVVVTQAGSVTGLAGLNLCNREARAVSTTSKRAYALRTAEICPREAPP